MADDRSKRLSQIFDPLSRLADNGVGPSSLPNSPRLVLRRVKDHPPPPPPPRPQPQHIDPLSYELAAVSGAGINPEQGWINWQERCLELQLELHRSRTQATRVRDMLRDKLSELEHRVLEAETRAEEAEDKVRAMEQRLSDWTSTGVNEQPAAECRGLSRLEGQIEEQKQLRLHDAKQVEAKAARIKEWVTNKLKDLEQQNQLLREQNNKCNQQLELLRNHLASQGSRNCLLTTRGSVSLEVRSNEVGSREDTLLATKRRRSECLEGPQLPHHNSVEPHYSTPVKHRRNLSIGTTTSHINETMSSVQNTNTTTMNRTMDERAAASLIDDDLAAAVKNLVILPMSNNTKTTDNDTTHDYAEIYTPNRERTPAWLDGESGGDGSESDVCSEPKKPPTPPLHRFPSWEAKIYQVAADGLQQSIGSEPSPPSTNKIEESYTHINVPVYATVKGRASQIRSMPFTGDSSDDSSDGEESVGITVHSTPVHNPIYNTPHPQVPNNINLAMAMNGLQLSNVNVPQCSSSENSLTASSPSKSSSLSPAKRSSSGSPCKQSKTRDTSFESGVSDDYAVPPDALSCPTSVSSADVAQPPSLNYIQHSTSDSPRKVEALEKSGHLAKLGGKLKTWRKRWFVLKNGILSYWKSQHDVERKPQGQISLGEHCRISRNDGAATFEINTGSKIYYLTADSTANMEEWIKILQNVQRRNATKLLLSKEDNKPTIEGWLIKVKNGHSKKCWCVLIGKMFLYYKAQGDSNPLGQINMRDARVEDVEHVSDSDSEEKTDDAQSHLTVAIYPQHQIPTYLLFENKMEKDSWLYHLTVVSGAGLAQGTPFEQLVQKLMETDGDLNCVLWKHPMLVYSKDCITSPLTSLSCETMQAEAIKLFKCVQLFMSVRVEQAGIDYHVVLAQNALQQALTGGSELQSELLSILCRQTTPYIHKHNVQVNNTPLSARRAKLANQLLLCATQTLFTCDTGNTTSTNNSDEKHTQSNKAESPSSVQAPLITMDCKSNPPTYSFVQGWQLLALAVSLFVPKNNRLLWYLKLHLNRNADSKSECGKYAAYCERALERTIKNGPREYKPSRMEVLSILLKNPYHHSLPHAIPVHMLNNTYQVVSFDGSTNVEEFLSKLSSEIGCREASISGFTLFSDDPIEKDLEHHIHSDKKLCDIISTWETSLREKGSGKFENSRVIRLTYRNRLYFKHSVRTETDKERLLLCYQINQQVVAGRFPVTRELAAELGSLMAQLDIGDFNPTHTTSSNNTTLANRFYPYRYRAPLTIEQLKELEEKLRVKWMALKGRSVQDCVRIYLNCTRKWPFFGATLFQARIKQPELSMVWLAVSEDGVTILELSSMSVLMRYPLTCIGLFGGVQDDLMMLINSENGQPVQKMIISLNKPKMAELTHLIADYKNALLRPGQGTPQMNSLTRNSSHKSMKKPISHSNPSTLPHVHINTHHNTINSHATTLTFGSERNATYSSNTYSHQERVSHAQPDIVKSTPDHKRRQFQENMT